MIVEADLSRSPGEVVLREPEDFSTLKVRCRGTGDLGSAIAPYGELSGDNVYLSREGVERLAGSYTAHAEWRDSLDAMIAYAVAHGWVDANGRVQAHVEREG